MRKISIDRIITVSRIYFKSLSSFWLVMFYTNEMLIVMAKFNSIFQLFGDYQIRGLLQYNQL